MSMRIYNTLTRELEDFIPKKKNRISMFVCGPTVYDYAHVGHARLCIIFDIIAKYLRYKGYSVFYVMNITDVDDKIIERAREQKENPVVVARKFENLFLEDMECLFVNSVNFYPRATDFMPEIINQITLLMQKGYAYETETGVYYDISKFQQYGKLSHQSVDDLNKHRIEPDRTKRNLADFALWKKVRNPDELSWDSPWGRGRPGWHIEDTAMTVNILGPTYDVHGGAIELVFPHHEAEIAQAEAATGIKPLVNYWIHAGLVNVRGEKMSKSLKNFITIREALSKTRPEVLRFLFASSHYRSPVDFDLNALAAAANGVISINNALNAITSSKVRERSTQEDREIVMRSDLVKQKFMEAMENDFNTPLAISALFGLVNYINKYISENDEIQSSTKEHIINIFKELGGIFGIIKSSQLENEQIEKLAELILEIRDRARQNKDWVLADEIRKKLADIGIIVEDTSSGRKWRLKS
jgi:cysteinyl-tRNA synthetase